MYKIDMFFYRRFFINKKMIHYPYLFRATYSKLRFTPLHLQNVLYRLTETNKVIYNKNTTHDYAYVYANDWKDKNISLHILEQFEKHEDATIYNKKGEYWTLTPMFKMDFIRPSFHVPSSVEIQVLMNYS